MSNRRIKAIDFFCGAGGLTRGLLDAGINVLAGIDFDERLRDTYSENNSPSQFICGDIHLIDIIRLRNYLGIRRGDLVLYAACTPCQPFSTLNRTRHDPQERRLLRAFARLVRESPPDFVLVENVPGLNGSTGGRIYRAFKDTIEKAGLQHHYADFLDAASFSVPQIRKRFISLSSRLGPIIPPQRDPAIHTVREVLMKYPPIRDGVKHPLVTLHHSRRMPPHHRAIVRAVPKDGGSRSEITDKSILLKCHKEHTTGHKDVFGRMAWDRPAPTLTRRCTDVYCGRFIHPVQSRGISLREAAALQTFPDDYTFSGSFSFIAQMIGNAVPVRFAYHLGRSIVKSIAAAGG